MNLVGFLNLRKWYFYRAIREMAACPVSPWVVPCIVMNLHFRPHVSSNQQLDWSSQWLMEPVYHQGGPVITLFKTSFTAQLKHSNNMVTSSHLHCFSSAVSFTPISIYRSTYQIMGEGHNPAFNIKNGSAEDPVSHSTIIERKRVIV